MARRRSSGRGRGRNRIGLQFDGWEELAERIDELAGADGLKRAVETALTDSKAHVNQKLTEAMRPNKLPAKGKYSEGDTLRSLDEDSPVTWEGMTASVKIGFKLRENLTSIFLMYGTKVHGTPRMKPDRALYTAIYGTKTKKELKEIQADAVNRVLREALGG